MHTSKRSKSEIPASIGASLSLNLNLSKSRSGRASVYPESRANVAGNRKGRQHMPNALVPLDK
jgi:hypothetical protein